MGTDVLGKNIRDLILRVLTVSFLASLFIVVLDSDLRSGVRSLVKPEFRVILAVATAVLDDSGKSYQILKVKTHEGLFLEVYGAQQNDFGTIQQLLATTQLPDKKDGYFTFNGEVTNLAIDDVDEDQKPEILATSFDNDLVAHLNVYRYIPGQKELQLVKLN